MGKMHCNMWTLFIALLACWLEIGEGANMLLTVPKQLHYDSEFTATVSASGVKTPERISLDYRGARDTSRLLNTTTLTFNSNDVKTWTVVFPWSKMEEYDETSVVLSISSAINQEKLTLKFSQETGYIFIQTDKPIYSPRQKVKFRILAVDEYQRLAKYPLKVDLKNEKAVVVDRMRYSAEEAFKGQEFELPKETPPGNWSISANFDGLRNAPSTANSVNFEVKEYVLPRFSANVQIIPDVITRDTRWVSITTSAKYVYGRSVAGFAQIQIGVWDPLNGVKLLPANFSSELKKGIFKKDILVSAIIPKAIIESGKNKRLYVSVNVTENGSQEVDSLEDTSTFIAHPFYDIKYDLSKAYFKPGFPYSLVTQVNAKSGRPGSGLKVWTNALFKGDDGSIVKRLSYYLDLDAEGRTTKVYDVPANAKVITFKTLVLDFKVGFKNENTFTVRKLPSENNKYLHISMIKPIQKNSNGLLKLRYSPMTRNRNIQRQYAGDAITILIVSKGHQVYTTSVVKNTDGHNIISLPTSLYSEISPYMRLVAFYHFNATKPEYVSDSLRIYTDHACLEELTIRTNVNRFGPALAMKPKEELKIEVKGGPLMNVGFVAVDKAVFLLNDRHTLTRNTMFEKLATHDLGTGIGDGKDLKEMFKNSGLTHILLETTKDKSSEPDWDLSRDRWFINNKPSGSKGPSGMRKTFPQTNPKTPDFRRVSNRLGHGTVTLEPPQTVRRYFPESWLFENHVLSRAGILKLNTTLPDSITTWSFLAVGISSNRGLCVSERLEQQVQKLFFVDVRLPYKSTRLEVVNVKIAIYNHHTYNVQAKVSVTGEEGICFSANQMRGNPKNSTEFNVRIASQQSKSYTIKVIPLRNGDLTLRVDISNPNERDVVEKKLYVVAEGLRVRKSLTFVLDPEAKHATFRPRKRNRVTMVNSAMINNLIDMKKKTQKTKIDLSMPREVIRGTEFCRVSIFGDLMGDIINHAVVKSKSLMEHSVQDAEEVIGDLAPVVHALLYANRSGLMTEQLQTKGHRFVRHGVARLLGYRNGSAFNLMPGAEQSTWLTAIVLKTLCYATPLAYIDKNNLIDKGFHWLLAQTTVNGTLEEKDWRLAEDSDDYRIMLSAEVLISLLECDRSGDEGVLQLEMQMAIYLEKVYPKIVKPMVLAKVAYALTLFEPSGEATKMVIEMLNKIRRRNKLGQWYWGDRVETNERKSMPFWYHKGAKASSIEATAYALLVYLNNGDRKVDAVADWLVAQRNDHGSFVGAMDSMAAIQALSSYSLQKQFLKVDLSCNVSFHKQNNFSHSFKFTEKNAIRPELLSNVPVGQVIEVLTKGEGLGQMQVSVEYNIPYDKNDDCPFNVTIEVKSTQIKFFPDMHKYPLCMSCDINCPKPEPEVNVTDSNCTLINGTWVEISNMSMSCINESQSNATATTTTMMPPKQTIRPTVNLRKPIIPDIKNARRVRPTRLRNRFRDLKSPRRNDRRRMPSRRLPNKHRGSPKITPSRTASKMTSPIRTASKITPSRRSRVLGRPRPVSNRRSRISRSTRNHPSASKKSICIQVCLQHLAEGVAGETRVEIEMLTGYYPVLEDIQAMRNSYMVKSAAYAEEKGVVIAILKKVANDDRTCVAFRAVDIDEIGRPSPVSVQVTETEEQEPSCVLEYHSPLGQESLQVFCADFSHINRGECKCYSGICSSCAPNRKNEIQLPRINQMVCQADVGYQVQVNEIQNHDQWVEIDAKVISLNKTGSHALKPNDHITMITPSSCVCPLFYNRNKDPLYLLSSDVEKMVNRHGTAVYRYVLDENSVFLRVTKPLETVARIPSVSHWFLNYAFRSKC